MELRDFLESVEGVDFENTPKAMCLIQDSIIPDDVFENVNAEPRVIDSQGTTLAEVNFAINNGLVVVSLTFEDFDDLDYMRFRAILENFEKNTYPLQNETHTLLLTITNKESYEYYMSCVAVTYLFDGDEARIRLLSKIDNVSLYQLNENDKRDLYVEAEREEEEKQRRMDYATQSEK